jgi:ribosomal-protein-alanine N-acetyltransferase
MLSWLRKLSQWPIVVASGHFQLRPMRSYDLLTVSNWFKDIEILRYAFGTEAEESSLREMAQRYQSEMDSQRQYILTLETTAQETFGFVRFNLNRNSSHAKVARIGILIGDKSYWGKGWGTEAVATFIHFLFTQKSVDRIELDTAHFNLRAQRCFEKCGFNRSRPPENYQSVSNDPTVKVWMELSKDRWQKEIKYSR